MVKPRHQFQVHAEATDPECFQEGKGKYINVRILTISYIIHIVTKRIIPQQRSHKSKTCGS